MSGLSERARNSLPAKSLKAVLAIFFHRQDRFIAIHLLKPKIPSPRVTFKKIDMLL
jgi:hypothetical protein